MARYDSILDSIGNTPLIRLSRMAPEGVSVFVKVESMNPMGSVKDRMANAIIERAEASGELRPGQTVIEATSGNTGLGLAMVHEQSRQVEKPRHPRDYGDDVQRLNPELILDHRDLFLAKTQARATGTSALYFVS